MNKYTELSDFEINLKVAHIVLGKDNYDWCPDKKEVYLAGIDGGDFLPHGYFDPCNNPSDAMPIIIESDIDLLNGENMMPELFGHHSAYTLHNFNIPIAADSLKEDKTIYRLGMEVFLMKKDAENN